MNMDERLEALTHSVELLAGMQIETEKHLTRLSDNVDQLRGMMVTLAEGMTQLTRIVLSHDQRLDNLEGDRPQ